MMKKPFPKQKKLFALCLELMHQEKSLYLFSLHTYVLFIFFELEMHNMDVNTFISLVSFSILLPLY